MEAQQRKIGSKQNWNLVGQRADPATLYPAYGTQDKIIPIVKCLDSYSPLTLLPATHFSLMDWFHFLYIFILGRHPTILASTASWCLHCNESFTFRASCNDLSGPPCRNSDLAAHCLGSAAFGEEIHHLLNFVSCMFPKPVFHGWYCQVLRTVRDGAWLSWTTVSAAFLCWGWGYGVLP